MVALDGEPLAQPAYRGPAGELPPIAVQEIIERGDHYLRVAGSGEAPADAPQHISVAVDDFFAELVGEQRLQRA